MDLLHFLYNNPLGRLMLRPLITPVVSRFAGTLMDTSFSKRIIPAFVKKNHINTNDYHLEDIHSFNDFFARQIKTELRPLEDHKTHLIAPCDGLLTVIKINRDTVIHPKQSHFTIPDLLQDEELAQSFIDGYCLIYRLCVHHYHRYIYFDDGYKGQDRTIDGVFHTVRPVALKKEPVFIENTRAYTTIQSQHFGRCVQMEVGAMLVGRIVNHHQDAGAIRCGEEKGHFAYGGSTIIVLIRKDQINLKDDIQQAMAKGQEYEIKMGEAVGERMRVA